MPRPTAGAEAEVSLILDGDGEAATGRGGDVKRWGELGTPTRPTARNIGRAKQPGIININDISS
jgi:hypothetical protein